MSVRVRGTAPRRPGVRGVGGLVALVVMLGSVTACGGSSGSGGAGEETEDGAGAVGVPALPAGFPTDLPFPSGEHERTEVSVADTMTTVVMEGDFDLDAELTHLRSAFDRAGYDVTQHTRAESGPVDQLYLEVAGPSHDVSVAIINRSSLGVATYEVTHQP